MPMVNVDYFSRLSKGKVAGNTFGWAGNDIRQYITLISKKMTGKLLDQILAAKSCYIKQ